jgi:hypothetical protein
VCWSKGYFEKKNIEIFSEMGEKHLETIAGERIQRRKIPGYATQDFWEAVEMWGTWKTFGLPEAGGLNDQPMLWMDLVSMIESWTRRAK